MSGFGLTFFFVLFSHPIHYLRLCCSCCLLLIGRKSGPGTHSSLVLPPPPPYGTCPTSFITRKDSELSSLVDSRRNVPTLAVFMEVLKCEKPQKRHVHPSSRYRSVMSCSERRGTALCVFQADKGAWSRRPADGDGGEGAGCTLAMRGRSRIAIEPRIPTKLKQSTSVFRRPGRYCLHQARGAVRLSGKPGWGEGGGGGGGGWL